MRADVPQTQISTASVRAASDRRFYLFNALLSVTALLFLSYILVIRRRSGDSATELQFLPAVNASLNATAAVLLCAGYVAIRKRARRLHKYLMVSAFGASSLFLICYVTYHFVHGDTKYPGTGSMRAVYLIILASHVLLSILIVPLSLTTLYFASQNTFARHRKIARVTLPLWLYVSVTGVVIFFMLRAATGGPH
jgi:putative membrane protein